MIDEEKCNEAEHWHSLQLNLSDSELNLDDEEGLNRAGLEHI